MFDRTACVWGRIRAREHFVWALYHKRMNLIRVYFLSSCSCLFHLGKKNKDNIDFCHFTHCPRASSSPLSSSLSPYFPSCVYPVFIRFSFISFHIVLIPTAYKEVLNIAHSRWNDFLNASLCSKLSVKTQRENWRERVGKADRIAGSATLSLSNFFALLFTSLVPTVTLCRNRNFSYPGCLLAKLTEITNFNWNAWFC